MSSARPRRGPFRLLIVLLVNAVPLIGIWRYGWGSATTLSLYWFESLVAGTLVFLRLLIHRQLTHDPEYEKNQLGVTISTNGGPTHPIRGFVPEFAAVAFGFTLVHGIFLWALLNLVWPHEGGSPLDPEALRRGVFAVLVVLSLGFLIDLPKLGQRPFAWVRGLAQTIMSRTLVVHLTLVVGIALVVWLHQPEVVIGIFAGLKLLVDLATSRPQQGGSEADATAETPATPPSWLRVLARLSGKNPQAIWDKTRRDLHQDSTGPTPGEPKSRRPPRASRRG